MGKKRGLQERVCQRTRQTNKTKNTEWSFKARRLIFKKNPISILPTEGHTLKETHSKAIGPRDKANYSNSNGSNAITVYPNDNDD